MRVLPLLFISLILISIAYGAGLDSFVFSHLRENESFTTEEILLGNEHYDVVTINENLSFLVHENGGNFELVTDKAEIKSVLLKYYENNGITYSLLDDIDTVPSLVSSFNKSRQPGEDECHVWTGTDKHPCVDRTSCQQACYSVTSLCQQVAQGAGWDFLDKILAFSNSTKALDDYALQSEPIFDKFSKSKSLSDLDALLDFVTGINIETTKINQNGLFSSYSFCKPIDYNLTAIMQAQKIIFDAKKKALPLFEIDGTVDAIANETSERALLEKAPAEKNKENATGKENATAQTNISKEQNVSANSGTNGSNNTNSIPAQQKTSCAPLFVLLSVIVLVLKE